MLLQLKGVAARLPPGDEDNRRAAPNDERQPATFTADDLAAVTLGLLLLLGPLLVTGAMHALGSWWQPAHLTPIDRLAEAAVQHASPTASATAGS